MNLFLILAFCNPVFILSCPYAVGCDNHLLINSIFSGAQRKLLQSIKVMWIIFVLHCSILKMIPYHHEIVNSAVEVVPLKTEMIGLIVFLGLFFHIYCCINNPEVLFKMITIRQCQRPICT